MKKVINTGKTLYILSMACSIIAFVMLVQKEPIDIPQEKDQSNIRTTVNEHEKNCMIEALYHEIRNGDTKAASNVADVIINRTEAKGFPSTVCGVVKEPKQFSYRNQEAPAPDWKKKVLQKGGADAHALVKVSYIAEKKLQTGAEHKDILWYTTPTVKRSWMKDMQVKFTDGYHKFFKQKPKLQARCSSDNGRDCDVA